MKKLLAMVGATALVLGGCDSTQPSGGDTSQPSTGGAPATPSLAPSGVTNVFGLLVNLDSTKWVVVERGATSASFILEYRGDACQPGLCPQLLFSQPTPEGANPVEGQHYQLSVRSGDFVLETECETNQSAFKAAQEYEAPFEIADKWTRYYINEPCKYFTQAPPARRLTWHLPGEELLVQYIERIGVSTNADVPEMLAAARW
jgi:hypothetical protein